MQEEVRRCFAMGEERRKDFKNCVNPNSSNQFLYFRAIQGNSGNNAIDPELQDNVLLPECFTEYIYRVGNASEMDIRSGLIPGGKSLKRGRQGVFFTTVNPMVDGNGMGETPRDLTMPRIAPYKNTWKRLSKYCMLVQFEARSRESLAVLPNTVTCSRSLQHTTACIEKAVCMKTEELYQKVRLPPRLPRVALKANSHSGQQDQREPRSKVGLPSESKNYRETWNNNAVDYRIPGMHLSTVEQQDTSRQKKVKKLIEKFEKHKHKESFLQDLNQTEDQQVQQRIEGFYRRLEQHRDLRIVRKFFQTAMS